MKLAILYLSVKSVSVSLGTSKPVSVVTYTELFKTSFFLTSSIVRQKYHNNLLPLVRVGLNLVGFARGYDIDGRFDRFHS